MRARAAEQLSAATAAMVTQGNLEAEAEAARKKAEKEAEAARLQVRACQRALALGPGPRHVAFGGQPAARAARCRTLEPRQPCQ